MTTHIQWTDETWNAITGCTKVSEGCEHCYIERTPPFRMAGRRFNLPGIGGTTDIKLHPERLVKPLSWRKPRRVFVNSLADLFHHDVPDEYIAKVFAVMAAAPRHTFQVLTKRHARMRSLLSAPEFHHSVTGNLDLLGADCPPYAEPSWPLPNVWVGVSVESQEWADRRIPALLETPAAVRWLSCEPLLGPVDLGIGDPHRDHESDDVHGHPHPLICLTCSPDEENEVEYFRREPGGGLLDWVVVGGESGPGARPMELAWARSLIEQCRNARVPVFVKQLGAVWASDATWNGSPVSHEDKKGGEPGYWPADLRVREYPAEVGA